MSYTKEILKQHLFDMGLIGTETIMIHSSMKSIGEVDGGVDTVVEALMEFFKNGLLLTPTHTWKQMSEEYNTFDRRTEPACVGLIPNTFMKKEGVVRSLHPTHSIAAYGKRAEEYIQGEENAKILLLGVTHIRNTYIHAVEEMFDVPERFTEKTTRFHIVMPDGSQKSVDMNRHTQIKRIGYIEEISDNFDKMKEGYFDTGAARSVQFGDAECILCDAKKLYEVTGKILEKEINCFIGREEIPREWYL